MTKHIQDKYYNLDQTQNTIMLICISNKINVDTFYLLHIIKIHRKEKNEKKVNKKKKKVDFCRHFSN